MSKDLKDVKKILVSDPLSAKGIHILKEAGFEVTVCTQLTKVQLLDTIKFYDALIVRSATQVTADVINAGTHLKLIGRAGTGVDNIDCEAAKKAGITVMNTPNSNTISAAEHTCGMILAMSRFLPQAYQSVKDGLWQRNKFLGTELYGKTLGIIGLGRVGREVMKRMKAFDMKVIGYDPFFNDKQLEEFGAIPSNLESLWPRCDFITVHVPLSEETKNLINKKVFAKCKPSVRIINVARGGIVNENDLLQALKEGKCAGAALDVFVEEPPKNMDLIRHPLVVCTPHLGANTHEAQDRVAEDIAHQFANLVFKGEAVGIIN